MGMIARTWFFYASLRTFCAQAVYICKMPDCFNIPYSPHISPIYSQYFLREAITARLMIFFFYKIPFFK